MPEKAVTIVVMSADGVRLDDLARSGHVWIADTPGNRAAAQSRWDAGLRDVTTFRVSEPIAPENDVHGILDQVLLHHPHAREIRVIGCGPNEQLRRGLEEGGFTIVAQDDQGFSARS
jgi:hypothetical protein